MKNSAESTHCSHCGLPVAKDLNIFVEYQGKNRPMCCYGCQAVSQAIIDSGMDDFYKYRTSTPEKPEEIVPEFLQQLKAYDSAAVQKKFVNDMYFIPQNTSRQPQLTSSVLACRSSCWSGCPPAP